MNERGWFTLMVRCVGLFIIAQGVGQMVPQVTSLVRQLINTRPMAAGSTVATGAASSQMTWMVWSSLAPIATLALGLYLFFGGMWIIDKLCREVVDRCRRCGYDLQQAPGGICPECGSALKPPEQPGEGVVRPHVIASLAVRFVGLCLVLWRLPVVLGVVGETIRQVSINSLGYLLGYSAQSNGYYLEFFGVLLQFILGIYMLLGGRRIVRLLLRGLPGVPGICERCGYDVAGLEGGRCPECGAKIPERQ